MQMNSNNGHSDFLLGLDIGGTKILASVFSPALKRLGRVKLSTKPQKGPEAVIERIARAALYAVDEADLKLPNIKAIGLGAPGLVDVTTGTVLLASNLNWHDVPLKEELEKRLGLPVFVENDCCLAALGIHVVELKSMPKQMLGIFIGTGVGGGLIVNGELYRGAGHSAGEIGHMVLDVNGPRCACGNQGCWEALASRTAMLENIQNAVLAGEKTILTDMLGPDLADMRSGHLRKAIDRGDPLVERVVAEAARYTGIAIANLANILNPEVVVLGGGVIEALANQRLFGLILETAREYAVPGILSGVEIMVSSLGDNAGITGAAVLARRLIANPEPSFEFVAEPDVPAEASRLGAPSRDPASP